jgi:putative transposase
VNIAPPAIIFRPDVDLTDRQRLEMNARMGVVAAIRKIQTNEKCSKKAAVKKLLACVAEGADNANIIYALRLARDGRGKKGASSMPSVATLERWMSADDLVPRIRTPEMSPPAWAKEFLLRYQTPQKPAVEHAYRLACDVWAPGERPSIHQVRRFLAKLGTVTRERGRMGPHELKNIRPFVRRDSTMLDPNDIWTADGHTFDAEVQHPFHGRPFRPEITSIVDVATRRVVGWSLDLAESSFAVIDAIRNAVENNGIPAIFYTDNGSGYSNAMMQAEGIGLMHRLGIEIKHSLPYSSQSRGVIERSHQTIWVAAARELPSYVGAAMDRDARLKQFRITRRALKKGGSMPLIPWHVFIQFVSGVIENYNARAHRTLKGASPDLKLQEFLARGWRAEMLPPDTADTLFRPRVTRSIRRGEITLSTNIYYARELEEFHGLKAQVAYDIHNPNSIWIYTGEGRFICRAEANGNRRAYMPVAVVEQARKKRAKGRLARVDSKREEILAELHGTPSLTAQTSEQIIIGGRVIDVAALAANPEPAALPQTTPPAPSRSARAPAENYADWLAIDAALATGKPVSETDARWHKTYQTSAQYRAEAGKEKTVA